MMARTLWNDAYEGIEESRNLSSTIAQYAPLFCIQIATSLLSVFATIVVVRISVPKLDSTYQRYIFMLNIALLVNSIFFGLHPLLTPKDDPGAYWAIGNSGTCTTVGFFLIFGSLMVSMYHTAISFYFYFSVQTIQGFNRRKSKKKKDTNSERQLKTTLRSDNSASDNSSAESSIESADAGGFGSKAEIIANIVCLVVPAVFAGTAATLESIEFNPNVDLCTTYGSNSPVKDTTWQVMNNIFRWTLLLSGTITLLITIVVRIQVGSFRKKNEEDVGAVTNDNNQTSNVSGSSLGDGGANNFEKQVMVQKLNAISAQCLFYTVSYVSSYFWYTVLIFISGNDDSNDGLLYTFQTMTVIFYPLLGAFNCAIYVRPRVQMLQIMYPEDSYIVVLRVAMSKAGDPEEIEEVRAKIYGDDYCAPEDDANTNERSDGLGGGKNSAPQDSNPPIRVLEFNQSFRVNATGGSTTVDGEEEPSVSDISDL